MSNIIKVKILFNKTDTSATMYNLSIVHRVRLGGQSNEIFEFFFHHLNQPGPLTYRLKYF